jgi:hypothetical protein
MARFIGGEWAWTHSRNGNVKSQYQLDLTGESLRVFSSGYAELSTEPSQTGFGLEITWLPG